MRFIWKTCFFFLITLGLSLHSANAGDFNVSSREEGNLLKRKIRASQFLHYATFGPTVAEIDALAVRMTQVGGKQALTQWIDEQLAKPASYHQPLAEDMYTQDGFTGLTQGVAINRYRHHAWWDIAIGGEDQLRQRMAWALAQIVVISDIGTNFNDSLTNGRNTGKARWLGMSNYHDMLVRNSFDNYRKILTDVTYHPNMGVYLSHLQNRKTDGVRFPDENYAREVMQLFSIGLYQLHKDGRLKTTATGEFIPTYDNDDITELARVFTGLTYAPNPATPTANPFYSGNDFCVPMVMYQPEHDTQPKTIVGNVVINQVDGNAEVAAALDALFEHDSIAPFISYRLIQRFTKSNPSRGYVLRVAKKFENNGQGVRGDLAAVIKAILLDPEPYQGLRIGSIRDANGVDTKVFCSDRGTEYARLREPTIQYTSMLRGVNSVSDHSSGRFMLTARNGDWTQEPYKQPSVFSFFLPSYQPPGDLITAAASPRIPNGNLVAPEFQLKTSVTTNRLINRFISNSEALRAPFTASGTGYSHVCNLDFNLEEELGWASQSEADLMKVVDRFDLLFCCGTMPQSFKTKIVDVINTETRWMLGNATNASNYPRYRVSSALAIVLTSPYAAIGH
jgi:uncharacterized protein (DUF1800 family)